MCLFVDTELSNVGVKWVRVACIKEGLLVEGPEASVIEGLLKQLDGQGIVENIAVIQFNILDAFSMLPMLGRRSGCQIRKGENEQG